MKTTRILPADQYDALEFAAEVEGGVGSGVMIEDGCAVCGYGLAYLAGIIDVPKKTMKSVSDLNLALYDNATRGELPFTYMESDDAVRAVQGRRGLDSEARVPFPEWAKELGLVRGK